jgi:hypothetical protein
MRRTTVALALGLALTGCTWVSLTDGGGQVQLIDAQEAAACEEVGRTRARTTVKIGPFSRGRQTVFKEQSRLARNEAARMGGNAVAASERTPGEEQEFVVYRCPDAE